MAAQHSLLDDAIQRKSSKAFITELPDNLDYFRLPDIPDIYRVAKDVSGTEQLTLLNLDPETKELGTDATSLEFVHDNYKYVLHPLLDCNHIDHFKFHSDGSTPEPVDSFVSFIHCHNNLKIIREGEYLDGGGLYRLSQRLSSWIESAMPWVGTGRPQNVWIAPDAYIIGAIPPDDLTDEGMKKILRNNALDLYKNRFIDKEDEEGRKDYELNIHLRGDRSKDVEEFRSAAYTIHFVHLELTKTMSHFALLIRQKQPRKAWYLDSSGTYNEKKDRKKKVTRAFNIWLKISGVDQKFQLKEKDVTIVDAPNQNDGWSCGLHAIANAVVFHRFNLLGWDKIPRWPRHKPNLVVYELRKSIDAMMRTRTLKTSSQPNKSAELATGKRRPGKQRAPDDRPRRTRDESPQPGFHARFPTGRNAARIPTQDPPRKQTTRPADVLYIGRERRGPPRKGNRSQPPAPEHVIPRKGTDDDTSSGLSDPPDGTSSFGEQTTPPPAVTSSRSKSGKGRKLTTSLSDSGSNILAGSMKRKRKETAPPAPSARPPPQKKTKASTMEPKTAPSDNTGTFRRSDRLVGDTANKK